jgi:hypothetical protein
MQLREVDVEVSVKLGAVVLILTARVWLLVMLPEPAVTVKLAGLVMEREFVTVTL